MFYFNYNMYWVRIVRWSFKFQNMCIQLFSYSIKRQADKNASKNGNWSKFLHEYNTFSNLYL